MRHKFDVLGSLILLAGSIVVISVALVATEAKADAPTLVIIPDVYYVSDVNSRGDLVGQYYAEGSSHGYLLRDGTYTTIRPPGSVATEATAINDRGDIVGTFDLDGRSFGYALRDGAYTALSFAPSLEASDINNQGDIVGTYWAYDWDFTPGHGYLLSKGRRTIIDFPGAFYTEASSINDRGDIVGIYVSDNVQHGYLLRQGVFTTIDPPGAAYTRVTRINNLGTMVGYYYDASGTHHSFRYADGVFSIIDTLAGATYTEIWGINNQGDLVGVYGGEWPGGSVGFMLRP